MKSTFFSICLLFFVSHIVVSQNIEDNIIKLSGNQTGVIVPPGLNTRILGVVNTATGFPDIFLQSDSLYPGVYVYKCISRDNNGTPVFGNKRKINAPFDTKKIFNGHIFQRQDNSIRIIWADSGSLYEAKYDGDNSFVETTIYQLPSQVSLPSRLSVSIEGNNKINLYASVPQGNILYPPKDSDGKSIPYKLDGSWRGKLNSENLYVLTYNNGFSNSVDEIKLMSSNEVLVGYGGITSLNDLEIGNGVVAGSYYGNLYYFSQNEQIEGFSKSYLKISDGRMAQISMHTHPHVFPDSNGKKTDILIGARGGIYYCKFSGNYSSGNTPIYEEPVSVLENSPSLYGGTMPVPTVVDVDKDGILDIIFGNAEGEVVFYKNISSNNNPQFSVGQKIKSNGKHLKIESGYAGSIAGPLESRLAFLSPNFLDWDGDGTIDMILNDARGKHLFYKGEIVNNTFQLQREKSLYLDGLELRGTWRNRPAVGYLNGNMAYITYDDNDELHLYWKIDEQNLEDGGKLLFSNGNTIKANNSYPVLSGRTRLELIDWDGDGVKDILLGVDRHHTLKNIVINTTSEALNGFATVLFLKNTGTEVAPKYSLPAVVEFWNNDILLGYDGCGVSGAMLGELLSGKPNIVVTDDKGQFYFIEQKDINIICELADNIPGSFIDKTTSTLSKDAISEPSLVLLPNGELLISYSKGQKTYIAKSQNDGVSWKIISELEYGKNGSLFLHDNQIWLIGSSHNVDNCVILKSSDNGVTWSNPTSPTTGLLMVSNLSTIIKPTSTPAIKFQDRIYKEIEQEDENGRRKIGVMSALLTENLLYRTKWTYSNYETFNLPSIGTHWTNGNVIVSPQNTINILSSIKNGDGDQAALMELSQDNLIVSFDNNKGVVYLPGAGKKFTIRFDALSNKYWAITNKVNDLDISSGEAYDRIYNNLVLLSSPDLINWTEEQTIFYDANISSTGFISTDWVINGSSIVGVSCLSWSDCIGNVSEIEKANYLISFKLDGFR